MSAESIILPPGGGRAYDLGPMRGVFKADGSETEDRYCASEWFVEPRAPGPGPHSHEANEEIFLVTEGTLWFLVGADWIEAQKGTFLRIPAGITHDFENRGDERAAAFNVFIPGGFERSFREWVEAGPTDALKPRAASSTPLTADLPQQTATGRPSSRRWIVAIMSGIQHRGR